MTQPPSFEPRRRGKRPSSDGARSAGRSENPAQARPAQDHNASPRSEDAPRRRSGAPVRRSAFPERSDNGVDQTRVQRTPQPGSGAPPPAYPPRSQNQSHQPRAQAAPAGSQPAPGQQPQQPQQPQPPQRRPQPRPRKKRSFGKTLLIILLVLLLVLGAWVAYLFVYGNSRLGKVDALSGAANTPGTTYLIVGSDKRGEAVADATEGERADTIMLLHVPQSGPTALVSLPRDTLVSYPNSPNRGKLNGAYSYGGPEYLVLTVEDLTGLTVDSYIEIGMDGVKNLTDAVGGIELCLDYDVSDPMSGLEWTAGCHEADGDTALAFSRMRYSDPLGDIGRNERQRQVVSAIIDEAVSPGTLINPVAQRNLVGSTADVLTVNEGASLMTVARAGLALRSAIGPGGLMGSPPIESLNYPGLGGASTVLLAPEADQFWVDLREGNLTEDSFASF